MHLQYFIPSTQLMVERGTRLIQGRLQRGRLGKGSTGHEVETIINILQMKEPSLKEIKKLAQGYKCIKQRSQ